MKPPTFDAALSFFPHTLTSSTLVALSCAVLYLAWVASYNLFLHPLHKYPGPFLARFSRLWYLWSKITGDFHLRAHRAHEQYGDVVRIAPDELSYVAAPAWKDIYSQRAGKKEMSKDPAFYNNPFSDGSVIAAPHDRHRIIRKLLSPSFSAAAIREREQLVESYAELLVLKLTESCGKGCESVNVLAWYNYFTFDAISDLVLGETFGCLKASKYHPLVGALVEDMRTVLLPKDGWLLPLLVRILVLPFKLQTFIAKFKQVQQLTQEMVDRRLQENTTRDDFLSKLIEPSSGVPYDELLANARLMFVAGGETTATQLATLTYLLIENPAKECKLRQELEAAFQTGDQITCESTKQLGYLNACIEEGLRLFPPVPNALPRRTPPGGDYVNGAWVPGDAIVSIRPWSSHRWPRHFKDPDAFVPERWMGDERYKDDVRAACQPFSTGPRNCIGMNYAYNEIRLALAKVIWHFDLELAEESRDWSSRMEAAFVWNKRPLMVKMKPVARDQEENVQ